MIVIDCHKKKLFISFFLNALENINF